VKPRLLAQHLVMVTQQAADSAQVIMLLPTMVTCAENFLPVFLQVLDLGNSSDSAVVVAAAQ
jgi:hypothetical protein